MLNFPERQRFHLEVKFLDLALSYNELKPEIDAAVNRVLASGTYILGEEVDLFEKKFATYTQSDFCVSVGSGLAALEIALMTLGIGLGDEVIVPSNTFIATWFAVSNVGAIPVSVDSDPHTYNLDPREIEKAISPRTKAIIPVHLYGSPADLKSILKIARKHRLPVIEDAAQAHGASYEGQRIGSHSDLVCWSFYPGKNLGAFGDGGAITTNNPNLNRVARQLRSYGSSKKYLSDIIGTNSRLDPLQAAILSVKLDHLDEWNTRRRIAAKRYQASFQNINLQMPEILDEAESSWHLFVIRTPFRDELMAHLTSKGVQTQIHYPVSPESQLAYKGKGNYKGTSQRSSDSEILSLPMGPHLNEHDQDFVINAVLEFFSNQALEN